jgi:hypothetical protein
MKTIIYYTLLSLFTLFFVVPGRSHAMPPRQKLIFNDAIKKGEQNYSFSADEANHVSSFTETEFLTDEDEESLLKSKIVICCTLLFISNPFIISSTHQHLYNKARSTEGFSHFNVSEFISYRVLKL